MEKPNYVLRFQEGTPVRDDNDVWGVIGKICMACIIIIIVGSLLFRENLLKEMSSYSVTMLIVLSIASFFLCRINWIPSELEWEFYDNKMVLYREKRVYSKKKARKEWTEVHYSDIKDFLYRRKSRRFSITCVQHAIFYDYRKDGTVNEKPSYDKTTDSGFIINLHFIGDLDIVSEIESHSPITIRTEDT